MLIKLIMSLKDNTPYSTQMRRDLSLEKAESFFLSESGLLYKHVDNPRPYNHQELMVIPQSLRKEIIEQSHGHPVSADLRLTTTFRYLRPGISIYLARSVFSDKRMNSHLHDVSKRQA